MEHHKHMVLKENFSVSSLPTWDSGMPGLLEEMGRGVGVCRQGASRHCQVLLVPLNLGKDNDSMKHETLVN